MLLVAQAIVRVIAKNRSLLTMALLKYFEREKDPLPDKQNCPSLTEKDLKSANEKVKDCLKKESSKAQTPTTRGKLVKRLYTPEQRAQIRKYAAENGPTRAAKHLDLGWAHHQIKIPPIFLNAWFGGKPPNLMTANISGYPPRIPHPPGCHILGRHILP